MIDSNKKDLSKKSVILVRGIPGSGKSTFSKFLGRAICSADDYHIDLNGNYNWKEENLKASHEWCKRKCERFMKIGAEKVIIDNTLSSEWEIDPYIDMAKKYGYKVFSIIIENRHGGISIHNVPEDTLEKMKNRFSIKL
ncbi:MAG TPA: ATP-binding protein [Candidatus Diapherotrites archaeon]|nr:ATP-binding protein [Candidatus Diapherotrites archaeon]